MLSTPPSGPIPGGPLQIGEVAELTGLSLRSIRHYEDVGLVRPTSRTPGGFRLYDAEAVERLRLVMGLKIFGLSLDEIRPLVESCRAAESGHGSDDAYAATRAAAHEMEPALAELEQRLELARILHARLSRASRRPRQRG